MPVLPSYRNQSIDLLRKFAVHIEFQEKSSPNFHSFIWVFNAPLPILSLFKKTINAKLPNHLNDLELFELVKTYQVHSYCRTCWKYNKNECSFSYGWYFPLKTISTKPLDSKFCNDEKQETLTWRNTLLHY